ncbi:MAG TPA: carboxypeptidase-like regulatory domain-containing protein, partial [Bacteroidetes bacterium]|nr:carboxypeptidase-like regulatory domain-containing protein [Bacteroidota bacterium]
MLKYKLHLSFLLFPFLLNGQNSMIFGIITDALTKEPVEVVTVFVEGSTKAVQTDINGLYKIDVPANKSLDLVFSRIGYKKTKYHIKSLSNNEKHQINVSLMPEDSKYEVTITGSRIEDVGMIREDIEELKLLPITSGNFESVLPSIALGTTTGTGGELSSQYNVRGGNYDENLVYVNDFEIYRPQLIQNSEQEGLSFPNPDLIKDLSFSSGGFEAKYGDKMSSVLDIHYKRPTIIKSSVSLSLLGGNAHVEGSAKIGKNKWNKLRILTGVRYKDNRYLLNSQTKKGEYIPTFTDVQAFIT